MKLSSEDQSTEVKDDNSPLFYHGTKAELMLGDLIMPGFNPTTASKRKRLICI